MKIGDKKVELAYVTPKEKELLLARDRAKGSITEKFHKGIPVLYVGGPGGSGGGYTGDIGDITAALEGPDASGDPGAYADITPGTWVGGKEGGYVSTTDASMGAGEFGKGHPGMKEPSMGAAEIEAAGGMEGGGLGVPGDGSVFDTGAEGPDLPTSFPLTKEGGAEGPDLPTSFPVDDSGKDTDPDSAEARDHTPEDEDTPHTPESCAAAGGVWDPVTRSCIRKVPKPPPGGSESSSLDTGYGADEPIEKAPRYKYREPTVKPTPGISETERVRAKVDAGTPLSVSVRDHLFGEATGVGSKYKRLAEMDEDREFREKQLAQAQAFASKGMSFSTAQLDAETDMIREAAKRRLITADEAAKLQAELQMNALKTAEPIELLAAAGKIGDAGYGGSFTPGAIDTSRFMDPERFGLVKPPGFSGLPAEVGETSEESGPPEDGITDGKFTDSTGTVCNVDSAFENADGTWSCPKSTTPPGGGGGEK
jgi:hypothetical protein